MSNDKLCVISSNTIFWVWKYDLMIFNNLFHLLIIFLFHHLFPCKPTNFNEDIIFFNVFFWFYIIFFLFLSKRYSSIVLNFLSIIFLHYSILLKYLHMLFYLLFFSCLFISFCLFLGIYPLLLFHLILVLDVIVPLLYKSYSFSQLIP